MNVYVHIPFCSNICSYCDFPKVCYHESYINKYLDSLSNEISLRYHNEEVDTLYIGGGTPSSLKYNELKKLLDILKLFKLSESYEMTFECNIENVSYDKLKLLYEYGINRLSFGVQTFNDKLLILLNRKHNKTNTIEVIRSAKKIGFNNINIDLIYGLPEESLNDLKLDIDEYLKLDINHISCYSLIIENNTLLKVKGYKNIDEDIEYEMYKYIDKHLTDNNYIHYEISNYAKLNYESRHNLVYWNNLPYIGFGMGAVSYIDNYRIENTKNLTKYINREYVYEKSFVSESEKQENEMILGLRKLEGVSISKFKEKYHIDIMDRFDIKELLNENKLTINADYIKINKEYIYVSNDILINFLGGNND